MVIDYRRLNAVTEKNRYPLPNIEEMKNHLTGATWYSKSTKLLWMRSETAKTLDVK